MFDSILVARFRFSELCGFPFRHDSFLDPGVSFSACVILEFTSAVLSVIHDRSEQTRLLEQIPVFSIVARLVFGFYTGGLAPQEKTIARLAMFFSNTGDCVFSP